MKKLLTLAIVFSLALVLSNVSFAQENAVAEEEGVISMENVEGEIYGATDACGPVMPCRPYPCRPFLRRACNPCYASLCNPCQAQPVCAPAPRSMCGDPCYAAPCAGQCDPCAYPGYRYTPIRNFFARVFAPRPYCGYDAYYGPGGFGYGCGPCGY